MATATITTTPDVRQNTNYDLNSHLSRSLKAEFGTVVFDGGTYADGGISWTPDTIALADILIVTFEPAGADQGGRKFTYDYTNGKIQAYESGTASASFDELDNASDTMSETLRYVAFGY